MPILGQAQGLECGERIDAQVFVQGVTKVQMVKAQNVGALTLLETLTLGTIHILPKQRWWVGGVSQMLTFAYIVGGWVKANAYVSKITLEN